MTTYDVAMAAVVIGGMVWGAWRGITWQLASIASLVLGYMVAFPLSAELAPRFPGEPIVARALALLVSYVAVSAGVFLAAWSIRATLKRLKFDAFDRHLGMMLGGLNGALLGVVVTVFVVSLLPQTRTPILTSPSGQVVDRGLHMARAALPKEIRSMLEPFWDAFHGEPGDTETDTETLIVEDGAANRERTEHESGASTSDSSILRSIFRGFGSEAGQATAEGFEEGFGGGWGRRE